MQQAKLGDCITVDYEGCLENGDVFESTKNTSELEFTLGKASVMMGFEEGMIGAAIGDTKEIVISPEDAFGPKQEELIQEIDRSAFGPQNSELQIGMIVQLSTTLNEKDQQIPATVVALSDNTVTVDYNHPLAGHTLTYNVTLTAIKEGSSAVVHVPGGDVENFKG